MKTSKSIDIQEYCKRLDTMSNRFIALLGTFSDEKLNSKIDSNVWTKAQILEHLILVNESYYPAFRAILSNTYTTSPMAKIALYARFCGNFVLKSVHPSRKMKIKTFPVWQPHTSQIHGILNQFEKSQSELKSFIQQISTSIENKQIISSPAHKHIVYPLDLVMEIIITHQERHYNQAKELLENTDFKTLKN